MPESLMSSFALDRSVVRERALGESSVDTGYWLTQPAVRRLQAIEFLRENFHGDAYPAQGLERVLRITVKA